MNTRLALALAVAREQGGVIGRRQLYSLGVTRWQVRAQLKADRWRRTGRQTVAVHTGQLSTAGEWWRAVLEVGPRAALDGATALLAAGLRGYDEGAIHVIAPKSSSPRKVAGVVVHESRRFAEGDVLTEGVRRVRPAVAAVHAALWARSDRQATLLLLMVVQQRIATPTEVGAALETVKRHPRRKQLRHVVADAAGGSESLGELDVLSALRQRGLPEPSRQAMRQLPGGRVYLDVAWEDWDLVLEIDGAQHDEAGHRLADLLRDLEVVATGQTVLRIPLSAWRLDQERVLDRLTGVFVSRGWRRRAA